MPGKILGNSCNDWKGSICKGVWACSLDGSGVICRGNVSVGQKKEICANGLDDDCDGKTDETYEYEQADPQRPLLGCFGCNDGDEALLSPAAGGCGARKKVCVGGEWIEKTAYEKKPEVCNGKDDDCNGMVDDIGGARSREEAGCQCFNGGLPSSEVCDGIDNDCNGQIDEAGNCCKEDDVMETGGKNVGICKPSKQICQKGKWVEVSKAVGPQQETCENDVDDNCDGQINEGCPEKQACGNGIKDGNEEGVDCGGSCAPCTALTADSGALLLAVAVLIIIVIGGALQFFGKI